MSRPNLSLNADVPRPRIAVPAGRSSILVAGRHLADAIQETYEIALWPSGEAQPAVLKQFRRDA